METTQTQIGQVGLDAPGDWFAILRRAGALVAYNTGASICSQGDSCAGIRYVVDGLVKLTTVSTRGRAAILGFLWTGDLFGESCLAGRARYQFSAKALANTS